MVRVTWDSLLLLLLAATDMLVSPPGPGGPLCHTAVSVLCHTWLASCLHHFPSPTMWRTFQSVAVNWRHRMETILHWSSVCQALLSKQLLFLYDSTFPRYNEDSCCTNLNLSFSNEVLAQLYIRFLHILGNIVEISQRDIICDSPGLFQAGLKTREVMACLDLLPDIFCKAMTVGSKLVNGYLGISSSTISSSTSSSTSATLPSKRPRCNTLLHMFGSWLFQAALLDTEFSGFKHHNNATKCYCAGRAVALETLCIIFNSKRYGESIEDAYIARFYLAIKKGLEADIDVKCSIMKSFNNIMSKDLPGINIIVPSLIETLQGFAEGTMSEESIKQDVVMFRKCLLTVTKTLLPLTHHFDTQVPAALINSEKAQSVKLGQLRENLVLTLQHNLQADKDLENCQKLLGMMAIFICHELLEIQHSDDGTNYDNSDNLKSWSTSLLNLFCYKLISSWTHDLATCLTACEVISYVATSGVKLGR